MEYRTPGKSDVRISRIGYGCMSLLQTSEQEARKIVDAAVDAGINYFDTADLYDKGENESAIGRFLKPVRSRVVIATKAGNQWREDGSGWDWNPRKTYIVRAVEESLRRLQTDYIDFYQLHGGTINDPVEEVIEAFEELVRQGKIKYYGLSSIRPNVIRKYVDLSNIQTVMMQYSLLDRRPEEEMVDLLHAHQISVLARGVLAQGLLIEKPAKAYLSLSEEEVKKVQQLLNDPGLSGYSHTALATRFVLNNPAIASVVVGFRTMKQLQDVLTAIDEPVPEDAVNRLKQQAPAIRYTDHR